MTADPIERARSAHFNAEFNGADDMAAMVAALSALKPGDVLPGGLVVTQSALQDRVAPWMEACFGAEISFDKVERRHRFIEEALELIQAMGGTKEEAQQLVEFVFDRPVGEPHQEVGGVMITLAALCLASDLNMHQAGEDELTRIWGKIETIRTKHATKPKHGVLSGLPKDVAND